MKTGLKKKDLEKLGKMTLAQKVAKAGDDSETPEEAAQALKGMLDKQEKTRVWSKYNTHLKHLSEAEKAEHQGKSKAEKGMDAAMHMVKASVPKFFHFQESIQHSQTLDKREKWKSEKKMKEEFGDDEFLQHLESSRIEWRDDPFTYGVYNYRDRGDITKTTSVKKRKEWAQGQEYEATNDDEKQWAALRDKDLQSHLQEAQWWKGKSLGKGQLALGKGKGKAKANKGKGKGKATQLAIQDGKVEDDDFQEEQEESDTEEEQWKMLLHKAKKARDQANSAKEDCEAALQKADLAKRLTKQAKKETEAIVEGMAKKVVALKDLLAKKDKAMSLEKGKSLVVEVMKKVKETKEESKELNQLANKAGSRASKQ